MIPNKGALAPYELFDLKNKSEPIFTYFVHGQYMRLMGPCVGSLDSSGPQECASTPIAELGPIRIVLFQAKEPLFVHNLYIIFADFALFDPL